MTDAPTDAPARNAYGELVAPTTLRIERLLPGPIERVWAYLADSELRRTWLAAGDFGSEPGTDFELVWRNDELTTPPGDRPEGMSAEHRATCKLLVCEPPHRLAFSWGDNGDVAFELTPAGERVRLTLVHSRLERRSLRLGVSAGWHAHLDLMQDRLAGSEPPPFWSSWAGLRAAYDARLPQ